MLDVRCFPTSGLQFNAHAQRLKPFLEIPEMLFRQNFRRRHQRDVESAFQRHQRAAGRHHGFAGTDIALQQPPHRMRAGPCPCANFAQHFGLRGGELETQLGKERFDQAVVAAARQPRALA